jgi:hypothetical protein
MDQVVDAVVLVADDVTQLLAGRRVAVMPAVRSSPHKNAVHDGRRDLDAMQPLEVDKQSERARA